MACIGRGIQYVPGWRFWLQLQDFRFDRVMSSYDDTRRWLLTLNK